MIRAALIDTQSGAFAAGGEELLAQWSETDGRILWLDLESHEPATERKLLTSRFGINNLAIDDAQRDRHPPKLEWFTDHYFLLLKAFNATTDSINFGILHISFFVGEKFIVTRHDGESPSINRIWSGMENGKEQRATSTNHICYRIVRTIVDRYTPIILKLEKRLEEMEDLMLKAPSDSLLSEMINYNSRLKKLRRIFVYQEAIFDQMQKHRHISGDDPVRHEFQDIHEQMERLASLTDLFQGLTRDLIDGYISVTSHRLNQIMKVLTIVAVIFLPLTFLAGIYGMNFDNMPELRWDKAYYVVLGVMLGLAVGMIALFRKLKWL